MSAETTLQPDFRRSEMTTLRGDRTRHVVNTNPARHDPGSVIRIGVPKLTASSCLVPSSLNLMFNLEVTGVKSHFVNNLARALKSRLIIKVAGQIIYDCDGENIYRTYGDLWKTKSYRAAMREYGILNQNSRKLISGEDTKATTGDAEKVADNLLYTIHGKRQRIPLNEIMSDHGLFAPFTMNNGFYYEIYLPSSSEVLLTQTGETAGTYSLEDVQLEYETIDNQEIANTVTDLYGLGKEMSFEGVSRMSVETWSAAETIMNHNINIPRKSMKAIVLLFKKRTLTDSEEYVYPNVKSVKVTIDGVPNVVFSQGIQRTSFYTEAKRFFDDMEMKDDNMTEEAFFKDKFALVIDLRFNPDRNKTGNGRSIVNTQNGVLLQITKDAHVGALDCHIFVVADSMVRFLHNDFHSVET